MNPLDLFKINAGVIRDLVTGIATTCPKAFVLIITNPVNSTLPITVETLKKHKVYNPAKVFGITTLDVIRASTFVAHALNLPDPKGLKIPVVGGHSGATILPLLSQCKPAVKLTEEQRDAVTYRKFPPIRTVGILADLEQGCNLAVTRLCRRKLEPAQQRLVWHTQGSGKNLLQ